MNEFVLLVECPHRKELTYASFDVDGKFIGFGPLTCPCNDQTDILKWYQAIPEEIRPAKDQPFYHLLAENSEASYVAYVSQQNLVPDDSEEPIDHPAIGSLFAGFDDGRYQLRPEHRH